MSSEEEQQRLDRRSEHRETVAMAIQVAIMLTAAVSLALWASGGYVFAPAWIVMAGILAFAHFYAQRTIRLLRRANRDAQKSLRTLQDQVRRTLSDLR